MIAVSGGKTRGMVVRALSIRSGGEIVIPGPSTHKTDEFGEDLRYRKSQDMDAAPRRRDP